MLALDMVTDHRKPVSEFRESPSCKEIKRDIPTIQDSIRERLGCMLETQAWLAAMPASSTASPGLSES